MRRPKAATRRYFLFISVTDIYFEHSTNGDIHYFKRPSIMQSRRYLSGVIIKPNVSNQLTKERTLTILEAVTTLASLSHRLSLEVTA